MRSDFKVTTESRHAESHHEETIELLRSEVAQLEQELAERDARITELSAIESGPASQAESPTESALDTIALVSRLEQLLDELDRKDEREASLQEALRVAEEANRAEQEERRHIEAWLGEIEQRVSQREAEWQAAMEELRVRLEQTASERDRAERALEAGGNVYDRGGASQEVIATLRKELTALQEKLAEKERAEATLKERPAHGEAGTQEPADKALREERLQLARERAELARQRVEIEHERHVVARGPDEIDQRVQALREHVRQIHERQVQEDKQREQGLSGRLVRLWKRLDGSA